MAFGRPKALYEGKQEAKLRGAALQIAQDWKHKKWAARRIEARVLRSTPTRIAARDGSLANARRATTVMNELGQIAVT